MRQQIQQFGRTLSGMVMPNIGAFIAWGFITALFIPEGWWPNGQLAQLVGPMLTYLLPLLIAYTAGRNVAGERGGVIGAIAAVGVIVGSDIPMFIGAMIMGPLAGYAIRRFDRMVEGRVKAGFEMLVSNFSIGILGMLLAVLGYYVVGSVVSGLTMLISSGAELVIRHGLLPLVSLFVEPAKVLFLNNAVNHGIFSPIGIEQARETGQSIMFLLETNPGPGLGVLLAYWLFGRGNARQSAPGAVIIQFFGGIHEIYFPYILARPVLIVAAIAGSAAGLLFFSLTDAGLVAPASPGSILSVLAMAPKGKTLIVLLGVVISAAVSLVVAAPFIRRASKTETEGDPAVGKLPQSAAGISPHAAGRPVRKVIFACDAGMGSSALGATRFRRRLRDAGIGVAVGNSAADRIPSDADVVVCQSVLAERIAAAAKGAELIVIDNFLSDPGLDALFVRLCDAFETWLKKQVPNRLRKLRPLAVYPVPGPHNPHSLATNPVCGTPRPIRPRNPKKPHSPPRTPLRTAPSCNPEISGSDCLRSRRRRRSGGRANCSSRADMPGRSMSMQCCAAKSWRRPVWGWGLRFRTEPPMPRSACCAPAS